MGNRRQIALAFLIGAGAMVVVPDVVDHRSVAPATASSPSGYLQPYAWGSTISGSSPWGQWGSLVTGASALSTTSPAGGGSGDAKIDANGPMGKFRSLVAFDGGTPLFFGEGGSGSTSGAHVMVAVENSVNKHELWGWGANSYGQLGNGTLNASFSPVKATWTAGVNEEIQEIALGERHTLMRTNDGTTTKIYAWGSNGVGQVGGAGLSVASTAKQTVPFELAMLRGENIVSIAAGRFHSVAADASGAVWVWGYDSETGYGNIGLPGSASRFLPEKLTATSVDKKLATFTGYSITNNTATVTTSGYHYFEKGDNATLSTAIPVLSGTKSITGTSNTGFSFVAQENVSTTADTGGAIAYNAATAAVTGKAISSNTATLTVGSGHNFRAGNVVDVSIGDPAFDGTRSVSAVSGTGVSFQSQPDVGSQATSGSLTYVTPSVAVTQKRVTSNVATLWVPGNNFIAGNRVVVAIGDPAFDGERVVATSASGTITFTSRGNLSTTAVSPVGSALLSSPISAVVTNRSMASPSGGLSLVTLTVPVNHGFKTGNLINVEIAGTSASSFNGTHAITAVGTTSVQYKVSGQSSAIASGSTSGSITMANTSWSVSSKAITSNEARITVGGSHGLAIGNVITVSGVGEGFDGARTLIDAGADWVEFTSQDNIASVATSGTVSQKDLTISVTAATIASNDATVTVVSGHDLAIGNVLNVNTGRGGNFDGVKTITAVGTSTITYKAQADMATTTTTGTVGMTTPTTPSVSKSITSNLATVNIGSGHAFEVGNSITVSGLGGNFDGVKTITSVAASTISYTAQANVGATTLSGSAEVDTCSTSCPLVPSGVVEVAAGWGHTIARTASSVLTWGFYGSSTTHYGRLGRSNPTVTTPSAVTLPAGCVPVAVTAAPYNGAVTCANNSIATWGYNAHGNLGRNIAHTTVTNSNVGTVQGISMNAGESIINVEMNHYGGIALTSAGRMFAWGGNAYRLLGTANAGSGANVRSLVAVLTTRIVPTGGAIVTKVFSDFYNSAVIDSSGRVWTWGTGTMGLSGRGTAGPVDSINGIRFYSIGMNPSARVAMIDSTYYATVVVMSDSTVWTLGTPATSTGFYFLGDGTAGQRYLPGRIDLPFGADTTVSATITQVACGTYHCLLATSNGSVYGWGDGSYRSLTLASTTDRSTPVLIKSGMANVKIAAGHVTSYYVDIGASGAGGIVYAWGSNANRRGVPQVSTNPLDAMTAVSDTIAPSVNNNVVAISAGTAHAVAIRADGTLMAWGYNGNGQLATGNTSTSTYYSEPVIPGGRVAASVHAAGNFTLVRATDGTLWGWGFNGSSVLGVSGSNTIASVTAVASSYTFKAIDAHGYSTTSALSSAVGVTSTGAVVAWGSNFYSQLGRSDRPFATTGPNASSATPVVVRTVMPNLSTFGLPTGVDRVFAGGWWSAAWTLASTGTAPNAPTSFSLSSPSAGTLNASWTAPSGSPAITGYVVEVKRGSTVVFRGGAGAGTTTATFSAPTVDILNGQTHTAVVYAVNEWGQSAASNEDDATPVGTPSEPRNFTVEPIAGGLRATWETPSDLAGLPIDDYVVTATPIPSGTPVDFTYNVATAASATYSRDLTSLTLGDTYSLTVKAVNAVGPGPAATAVSAVPGRPSAPRNVAAVGGSSSATVTWAAPLSDGGIPVASYVIKAYATGTTNLISSAVSSTLSATLTGLIDSSTYDVTVTASHAADALSLLGLPSDIVKVMPGRPIAPVNVAASASGMPTGGKLTVTWGKVLDQPGVTIGGYQITHVTGSTTVNVSVATTACSGSTCTHELTGLVNGSTYSITVRARSTASTSAWGLSSSAATGMPIGVTSAPVVAATRGDTLVSISLSEPVSLNGSAVISYTASIALTSGGAAIETVSLDPNDPNHTFDENLVNGTSYTVSVTATNEAGVSAAATTSAVPATISTAPRNVRARPGSIIVTWDAPTATGGTAITDYEITVTSEDGVESTYLASSATNASSSTSGCSVSSRSCTILKVITAESEGAYVTIPDDVVYTVSVVAINAEGSSPPSDASVLVSAQPDAPTAVVGAGATRAIDLCWTAPTGTITAYRVNATFGSQTATMVAQAPLVNPSGCTSPSVGVRIENWDDGSPVSVDVLHTLTVQATVSASDYVYGIESTAVTATPYDTPLAPTILRATTTASAATVEWSAAANRGSVVLGYTLTAQPSGDTCSWTSGPLECTLTGLTGNATYAVSVVASNAAGDGPASATYSLFIDATAATPTWGVPRMGSPLRSAYTATFDEDIQYTLTFDENVSGFTAADLRNAGTATGCAFGVATVVTDRQFTVTVRCASEGTLIAEMVASSVNDVSGNPSPSLDVSAAQVTLYDPSTTTTIATPTTVRDQPSKQATPDPGADGSSSISTTLPRRVTTTTVGEGSGLPPSIDRRLKDDDGLIADVERESPTKVGQPVVVERCGFRAGELVRLYVGGNLVRAVSANGGGCIEEEVVIPDAPGKTIVIAVYAPGSKTGWKTQVDIAARLVATGGSFGGFLILSLLLLAIGAAVLVLARRRSSLNTH